MLSLIVALTLPLQAQTLTDPACGTVVAVDETEVTYTQPLDCGGGVALSVTALDVVVDGSLFAIDGTITATGADGLSIIDIGVAGVDVTGTNLLILSNVTSLGALGVSGGGDVFVVDSAVRGAGTCLSLAGVDGDNEIATSSFNECTTTGIAVTLNAGATLSVADNAVTSTVAGAGSTGISLSGLDGEIVSGNVVAGFDTAYSVSDSTGVTLEVGDNCGPGAVGVRLDDAPGSTLSGSVSSFAVGVLLSAGTTAAISMGFSNNVVDVVDQGAPGSTTTLLVLDDVDADGTGDVCDNCAFLANPDQGDVDGDRLGDVCDGSNDGGGGGGGGGGGAGVGLVFVTQLPADDLDCPGGGVRIDAGVDDNGDGFLSDPEIDTQTFVCDGQDGADGDDGDDGVDGVDGVDGAPGQDGQDGAPGPAGPPGEPGFVDANADGVDDRTAIGGGAQNCASGGAPVSVLGLLALCALMGRGTRRGKR